MTIDDSLKELWRTFGIDGMQLIKKILSYENKYGSDSVSRLLSELEIRVGELEKIKVYSKQKGFEDKLKLAKEIVRTTEHLKGLIPESSPNPGADYDKIAKLISEIERLREQHPEVDNLYAYVVHRF